ncbi:hypothetical protein DID88_008430 [Monilinia fructigena]|uniref:Uncharacterized protein n=1 Tax=Monilinia fructigena TaxID=38457 RepID=A0A395JAG0_9HELO|nr:hypothetical protein DID88_008430 [Monilinia fructigena]
MPSNKDISSLVNTSDQTFLPPETKNSDVEMGVQEEQEHQLILDYYKLKAKNNLLDELSSLLSMRKLNGDIAEDVAEDVAEDDLSDHSSDEDFTEDDSSDEDFTEGDSLDEDLAEGDSSGDQYVTQDVSSAWDVSTDENILRDAACKKRFISMIETVLLNLIAAKNASLYPKLHSLYDYARDDELFIEDLVKEEFGGEFVDLYFGEFPDWSSPYCQILFKLPIAIYKAGHLFDKISVEVTYPIDYNLKASPEEIKELSAASQNLKQFTFYCARRHYDGYNSQLPPQSLGGLIVYLSSVLNTDCLEKVDINLAYFNAHSIDIDEGTQ